MIRQEGHSYAVDYWTFGIFLYEMLVGSPPFIADSRTLLYEKIKKGDFPLPMNMDSSAKDILKRLLQVNVDDFLIQPQKRLGSTNGTTEIMSHSFFKEIDFQAFKDKKITPPIVPLSKLDSDSYGANGPAPIFVENILQRTESSDGVMVDFTNFTYTGHKDSRCGEEVLQSPR